MLKSIMKEPKGRIEVDYCILIPNPEEAWIIQLLFDKAVETGWGQTRLARWLNAREDIPAKFKPFQPPSVGYWLENPIYYGALLWEQKATEIVNDTRVVERNPEEDMTRVPDFCEPLVSRETWDKVQSVRQVRRERMAEARRRKQHDNGKRITAPAPGLALKYLLTGLVRCGHCGRSMSLSSSPKYVTKDGTENRYTGYVCPGYLAGVCPNSKRVPGEWLRTVVVEKIREQLFPGLE